MLGRQKKTEGRSRRWVVCLLDLQAVLLDESTSEWPSSTCAAGLQRRGTSSPQRSQSRLIPSSLADTFYNRTDRSYFLLKPSRVGLAHAELTSILAG